MRNIFIVLCGALAMFTIACSYETSAPDIEQTVELLPLDSRGIEEISQELSTPIYDAENVDGSLCSYVEYDTIVNKATGNPAKTVAALTLYIDRVVGDADNYFELPSGLQYLENLRSINVYFAGGSYVDLENLPSSPSAVTIGRVPGTENQRIILKDKTWDKRGYPWYVTDLKINGTDLKHVRFYAYNNMSFDVSDNMIEDTFDSTCPYYLDTNGRVNLSNNKMTIPEELWAIFMHWTEKESDRFPDLRNNDIEIPRWVARTSWYSKNRQWFEGNPGYVDR